MLLVWGDQKDHQIPEEMAKITRKRTFYVNWNVFATDLEIDELLGTGATCEVYRGRLMKNVGKIEDVAVKRLRMYSDEKEAEQQLAEIKFLKQLEHRNIIEFKGVVFKTLREPYRIVTELASKGSLYDYLQEYRKTNTRLPEKRFQDWCMGGARAIQYLQKQSVAHMDIKSKNFLITHGDVIKLCDFGIARNLEETIGTARERGTIRWMAPEVFKELVVSFASDIYSYSIVVWELFTCEEPFKGMATYAIMWAVGDKNKRPEIPSDCPGYIRELLVQCWNQKREERPHIDNVVACLKDQDMTALTSPKQQSHYMTMRPCMTAQNGVMFQPAQDEKSDMPTFWPKLDVVNPNELKRRSQSLPHLMSNLNDGSNISETCRSQTQPTPKPSNDVDENKNQKKPLKTKILRHMATIFNPEQYTSEAKNRKKTQWPAYKIGDKYKTARAYRTVQSDEIDIDEGQVVELISTDESNDLWLVSIQDDNEEAVAITGWIKPGSLQRIKGPRLYRRKSQSVSFEPDYKPGSGYDVGKSTFYDTKMRRQSISQPNLQQSAKDSSTSNQPCLPCQRRASSPAGYIGHRFVTHKWGQAVCKLCNKLVTGEVSKCKACSIKVHKHCVSKVTTPCCTHHDNAPPSYPPPRSPTKKESKKDSDLDFR